MAPGPNSTSKVSHEGRIAQIHISRLLVHSLTDVGLQPTLTLPIHAKTVMEHGLKAQTGIDLAPIPCEK